MTNHTHQTRCGIIHYWLDIVDINKPALVFLPGLTADHRLFDKQIEYFSGKYNIFVWDAPGHGKSWPFSFDFELMDKAMWLKEILDKETEVKDLKRKYFGNDGELYKKRESLMKPIQEEIYNAIKDIAEAKKYMRVDDRASSPSILFANPAVDISDDVLTKLGYAK